MKICRAFSAICCLLMTMTVLGQPPAGSNWQRVQQLPPHTKVHVSSDKGSRVCSIDSVDEQTLTCSGGHLGGGAHHTFNRSEIKSVKITRYIASTAIGAGIGAGAGAGVFAAINSHTNETCSFLCFPTGEVAAVGAAVFAIPGGIVGLTTDFARGTVYRRPKM